MSENTTPNTPNFLKKTVAVVRRHERKILIATTVTSTAAAVLMRTGIAQHNAFLKENGLYEKFYALDAPTEA